MSMKFSNSISNGSYGINRQAIINGNADVAQRGASVSSSATNNINSYGLNRWITQIYGGSSGSGTATHVQSQQAHTLGQAIVPYNPKYFMRINPSVLPTAGGTGTIIRTSQRIEGVQNFAGRTASLSFWAKADSTRTISVILTQLFGTGGSPSTLVDIAGNVTSINLTTSWQKFTVTFNVPSISGKTLGSNGDDQLDLMFIFYKLDNTVASLPSGAVGTYATGNFDFSEVILNDGDAQVFQPKSTAEETKDCMRYALIPQTNSIFVRLASYTANTMVFNVPLPVQLRVAPTILGTINTDMIVYSMASAAQSGFTAAAALTSNGLIVTLTKTTHGLTDGYLEIKTTSGFTAEL